MLLAGLVSLHTENLMIILCLYHLFFTHHHLTHSRSPNTERQNAILFGGVRYVS